MLAVSHEERISDISSDLRRLRESTPKMAALIRTVGLTPHDSSILAGYRTAYIAHYPERLTNQISAIGSAASAMRPRPLTRRSG